MNPDEVAKLKEEHDKLYDEMMICRKEHVHKDFIAKLKEIIKHDEGLVEDVKEAHAQVAKLKEALEEIKHHVHCHEDIRQRCDIALAKLTTKENTHE